jgi:hypothetical protein
MVSGDILSSDYEVRKALLRYARGIDRGDEAMALSAFHPDARLHHGLKADVSPVEWVRFVLSRPPIDRIGMGTADPADDVVESQQHHITQQMTEFDGDIAYSEAYFLEFTMLLRAGQRYLTSVGGRYIERYERRAGNWRIIERYAARDWDSVQPVPGRFPGWEKSAQGRRDRTDPSYWSGRAGRIPGEASGTPA